MKNKLELSCAKLKQAYASYILLQQVMNKLWEVCEIKLKLKFELQWVEVGNTKLDSSWCLVHSIYMGHINSSQHFGLPKGAKPCT